MADYLKKHLATNIPQTVYLKKRMAPKDEKKYQSDELTGKQEYPYVFVLNDNEVLHYAKEYEEETLKLFNVGDTLQVVRQEKTKPDGKSFKIMVWTPPEGTEATAAASPQPQSNTATQKSKESAEQYKKTEEEKWHRIDTSKIVFGYMNTALGLGKSHEEAAQFAFDAYRYQEATVRKIVAAFPLNPSPSNS